MSDLSLFVSSRQVIRSQVSRYHNKRLNFPNLSTAEKKSAIIALQSYRDQLRDLDKDIQSLKWQADQNAKELEREILGSEPYVLKITECLDLLGANQRNINRDPNNASMQNARGLLRNPNTPLPKYNSTDSEDLNKFLHQFEETLAKFDLEEYDLFILLQQQISGRALHLINSLEIDEQSYTQAKQILKEALAAPESQKFNIIKQLNELKLTYNGEPFQYISQVKALRNSVRNLNITAETFLQYYCWTGLNESFKNQLINITGHTRPTLQEIMDNFFDASERYKNIQKHYESKPKPNKNFVKEQNPQKFEKSSSASFAANVNYTPSSEPNRFRNCSICNKLEIDSSHPIFRCPKFDNPKIKIEKIKQLKGCIKCAQFNHETDKCHFHFKNSCSRSGNWHFSFLCTNPENGQSKGGGAPESSGQKSEKSNPKKKEKSEAESESKSTNSMIVVTEAFQSNLGNESILPTFTCKLKNDTIRILKDGGSQENYITMKLAESKKLKILKRNVSLTVNGFNSSQNYEVNLVEVPLKINDRIISIEALCIPSIKIHLKLPKLDQVVHGFLEKGYKLADSLLQQSKNEISNIDLILGSGSAYCMLENAKCFGAENKSVYSQTPQRVILMGKIEQILKDLKDLPNFKITKESLSSSSCKPVSNNFLGCVSSNTNDEKDIESLETNANFSVISNKGKLIESELQKATEQILENNCIKFTNYDTNTYHEESSEINDKLVKYALDSAAQNDEGRLTMNLLWNNQVSHLLGKNQNLAKLVLNSNLKKLKKKPECLKLMNETILEQEKSGIIEKIPNLEQFLQEHIEHSFLPHMGVFKLDRATTKCRVVYLSNICQQDKDKNLTVTHNQNIHAGPSLNFKISAALLHLRFDAKLLCFDICKAFNQIALNESDMNKLLFLWFRNVEKNDFSIVAYRNKRLPFGLRCSPTLLLLSIYKLLIIDAKEDDENLQILKKQIYQLSYMDNLALTGNSTDYLSWAYEQLEGIFGKYKMELQQFVTNDQALQNKIDSNSEEKTPQTVKLFGIQWDRQNDLLHTKPLNLDSSATTKRLILASIASQFDIYNINCPILNRARIFMHELQCDKSLGWDSKLSHEQIRTWKNIANKINAAPPIKIDRFVGDRNSTYRLIAFTDSSKLMYGAVIFIQDLKTNKVSFLCAKNRIVNKQLEDKSIPSLEFHAISLGCEVLIDMFKDLAGPSCVCPIDIKDLHLYSDSLVSLTWLNSSANKFDKMQKRYVFVMNRLNQINKLCEIHPIEFSFVAGLENPADAVTRCLSYKKLLQTNFISGPAFLKNLETGDINREGLLTVKIPNPLTEIDNDTSIVSFVAQTQIRHEKAEHFVNLLRFSNFKRLVNVNINLLSFVNGFKDRLKNKDPEKYQNLSDPYDTDYAAVSKMIIAAEQRAKFPEVFEYFNSNSKKIKDIPNIVNQLNVYPGADGLLRVKSKFNRWKDESRCYAPILLPKNSHLTFLIIRDLHEEKLHIGCYQLLAELRKRFWIPHFFSVVKRTLKKCIYCRRYKQRTVKLNQSPYKELRINPSTIPYRNIYLDHLGPYYIKWNNQTVKIWLLCITCMYTGAINLKICMNLTVTEFLRAFQIHTYEYGICEYAFFRFGVTTYGRCRNY